LSSFIRSETYLSYPACVKSRQLTLFIDFDMPSSIPDSSLEDYGEDFVVEPRGRRIYGRFRVVVDDDDPEFVVS
jgi:hypothetical protein